MRRRALSVGLTGGIGSGKSLALAAFARLGAETASADDIARRQAEPGGPAHRRIVALFGRGILDGAGRIDRKRLAQRVFSRPSDRRRLERATHPLVLAEVRRRAARAKGSLFVADIPLLFEARRERDFDVTMAIATAPGTRLARLARRDGMDASQARRRMAAQLTESERARRADVVVPNEGSRKDFVARIGSYHRALTLLSRGAQSQ